ncbi:MAG: nucleotidyltransferase family protein [Lentihominibacter sp.]|jgi:predicted nucleotidyltransferase
MSDKIYSIEEIQTMIKPIAENFGVERIYLFGSYARGEATPDSDMDFRVDKGKVTGFAFGGLINAISDTFDKEVDVVTTASLDQDFLRHISEEEVLLYA